MRILVVANLTLCGPHLLEEVEERISRGPSEVHVLVPANRSALSGAWTEDEARAEAEERLTTMLATLADRDVRATGQVGDIRAIDATLDALRAADYDEVIISTLPPNASRWLRMDLVSRLERAVDVPVTHVIAEHAEV